MCTVRLFDEDSHIFEFSATVISCDQAEAGFKVVLDKTAFFPEGGGQYGDRGFIDSVAVTDTQIENGIIYHFTDKPLEIGTEVKGALDKKRRFAFMQNHSGEHIISGLVHKRYGFDNVGFHLGEDFATLDFNGILNREQLDEIELLANERVWQNLPIKAYYPTKDELSKTDYRSKKELDGEVRLVVIENTDVCACCAPHVKKTGEIGAIKLLDTEKMRGGTRIVLKCGYFAVEDYKCKYANIADISARLSAKQENAASAVAALEEKLNAEKQANAALKKKMAQMLVDSIPKEQRTVVVDGFDRVALQTLADGLHKTYGGIRAVFSQEGEAFAFVICGDEVELNARFAEFKSQFAVRGGGRGCMVQGSVAGEIEQIKKFF